jgi:hypothetical protein
VSAWRPKASSIWAIDCQIVTNNTPSPARVDACWGKERRGVLPASSMTNSNGGSRGLPVAATRRKTCLTRSLSSPPNAGARRAWSSVGAQASWCEL